MGFVSLSKENTGRLEAVGRGGAMFHSSGDSILDEVGDGIRVGKFGWEGPLLEL